MYDLSGEHAVTQLARIAAALERLADTAEALLPAVEGARTGLDNLRSVVEAAAELLLPPDAPRGA